MFMCLSQSTPATAVFTLLRENNLPNPPFVECYLQKTLYSDKQPAAYVTPPSVCTVRRPLNDSAPVKVLSALAKSRRFGEVRGTSKVGQSTVSGFSNPTFPTQECLNEIEQQMEQLKRNRLESRCSLVKLFTKLIRVDFVLN